MPTLTRMNPETACVPSHHPHRMVCDDADDDCWDEWRPGRYEPYNLLECCECGQEWPCAHKRGED